MKLTTILKKDIDFENLDSLINLIRHIRTESKSRMVLIEIDGDSERIKKFEKEFDE